MEFTNPFRMPGNWYKGNLHTHTTNSDGRFSPEEIVRIYGESGYDFLCITDHNSVTEATDTGDMTLLRGSEIDIGSTHIVAAGLPHGFSAEGMAPGEIIEAINKLGAISIISHPYWSGLTVNDLMDMRGYDGIEIYNRLCENLTGQGYSTVHLDDLLRAGRKTFGFASDDTHSQGDLVSGFIMVKSPTLSEEDIKASIKKGAFYSSTGVIVEDLEITSSETVEIIVSSSETVDFIGSDMTGGRVISDVTGLRHAAYKIRGVERYLRIEVTDSANRKAWVNPIIF